MWPFRKQGRRSRIDATHPHVLIIGNGITGITAALQIRRNQPTWKITVISGESQYFYSRPALMYLFMGHMRSSDLRPYSNDKWPDQEIDLIHKWVMSVNVDQKTVALDDGRTIRFDKLLLATGSQPNRFGWPGQSLKQVQGLYSLQDLEKLEETIPSVKTAVIVGGGLIGVELAEMLHSRKRHVVILCREELYWDNVLPTDEARLVTNVIREHGIEVRLSTELKRIVGDEGNNVVSVELNDSEEIACEFVGLTAGVHPNIDLIKPTKIAYEKGILVDSSFRTSIKDIFAAGDCAQFLDPDSGQVPIEQLWYTGKKHGEVVGDVISGQRRTYQRGVWFNSAKFFDLEYQTYGQVPSAQEQRPELRQYWWSDNKRRGLRIVCDLDQKVIGMNALGIRHRHQVWNQWLEEKKSMDFVLDHLKEAEFDPEFYATCAEDISSQFRNERQQ